MKKLIKPEGLTINFTPSEKQLGVWNALQPNYCDHCGNYGLEMRHTRNDEYGNPIHEAVCTHCGNTDISENILQGGAAGGGKGQLLDAEIVTPSGIRRFGDLKVGDLVISATTGDSTEVVCLHPIEVRDYYRVSFVDGTHVDCSDNHIWRIYKSESSKIGGHTLMYAHQLHDWFRKKEMGLHEDMAIMVPLCKPVKFIHEGVDDRVEKLECLLKEHGCVNENGSVSFSTDSKLLADNVAFMARSLGKIVKVTENKATGSCDVLIWNAEGKQVTNVEYIGKREGRCITVSDSSGLYVTDGFTVTHNSYLGCVWLASSCIRFNGIRMAVARLTLKSLRETTWSTLYRLLLSWGLKENVHFVINNQFGYLDFWNGSRIQMVELSPSLKDPDYNSLGSLEITGAFVDEVSEICEKAVIVLASRIRYMVAETFVVGKIVLSTNPCQTWVRSTYVQDDEGNKVKLPNGYRYIPFTVFDNPDEKFRMVYFNKLRKIKDKATRERLTYGNWDFVDSNKMAAYWNFNGEVHIVTHLKEKKYSTVHPLIISMDFNVNPYMSALPIQIDYSGKNIYIFPEYVGRPEKKENNTPAFSRMLGKSLMADRHIGGVILTGDPAGASRSTQTEDGVNNFTIARDNLSNCKITSRVEMFNKQPAHTTRLEFVNEIMNGYEGWHLYIDVRCRRLTEDFVYQKKNPDGTKEKKKVLLDNGEKAEKYGHMSDCFDYALTYFLSEYYNKYRNGSVEMAVTTIDDDATVYNQFSY